MAGTLYTYPNNFRAFKALVAAKYSGTDVTVVSEPPQFILGETNKSDSFIEKFPLGKVPAYEAKNGDCVFESNAIAYYVANAQLRGSTPEAAAKVQQWVNFADSEILPAACAWVFPCLGIMQFNKQNTERAKKDMDAALGALNRSLAKQTFLVGERVTLADIVVACNLLSAYEHVLEPAFRKAFPNTNRWFTTVINQPQFKAVIGDFKLCEKMAQFDSKKFAELSGKAAGKGKEKKEKPKKEEQKKVETKPEPAAEPKPVKSKDPYHTLPESKMVFDDWKKMYSNNEVAVSMPWFWENVDRENCSLWFCKYKYSDEFTMTFMASNLVSGMFQRLDKMRKHAFGSMVISAVGKEKSITGVWVWRGTGLVFDLDEDIAVDSPYFDWTKLDFNSPETKELVEKYFAQEEEGVKYDGLDMADAKIFK